MRTDPFHDSLLFLIGETPDHDALGWAKYFLVIFYAALLIAAIAIAIRTWFRDPAQRTARNAWIWLARTLVGTMWFQGSLWKLPLPVSSGFQYWTGQLAENSFIPAHAAFVRDVLLPHINILDPLVWLTETTMATALILGFAVPVASLVAILFTLNLWVGLYHNSAEWPWEYVFIVVVHGFFMLDHAGRSLGLDAHLTRTTSRTFRVRAWRLAS